ncbi:caspase family protein [Spirosoma sp. BT702]|uniref:Caspase family protein n=1 Tax=Spirosoma profusum TaxID=2771354 RepID=A0A926Y3U1_9BACT|nr:caspase family protein [Spirosoma profusum]MBD2704492.1 caspase family protein [Spirosoma profusum]
MFLSTGTALSQTAQEWVNRADRETNYVEAERLYTEALRIQPLADAALLGRAIVRGRLERFDDAIADATAAIALVDTSARYYAQRAYLRVQIHEYDRAATDYERAIKLKPREANYYSGLSYCRVKLGRYSEALTIAQKGIDLNPTSPYPYRNRGRAKMYSGKIDDAIADFQQSLNRKHGEAHRVFTDLGEAYERKNDLTRASDYYNKALNLKPGYPDAAARLRGLSRSGESGSTKSTSTFTGKRVALIIGNSEYTYYAELKNQPINDADSMNIRLNKLGFSTTLVKDTKGKLLKEKIKAFCQAATNADLAFFYFAGHGLQYNGTNYLLPVDMGEFSVTDQYVQELTENALLITTLIEQLQQANPKFCMIVLDACRETALKGLKTTSSLTAKTTGTATKDRFPLPPFAPIVVENFIRNCCVAQATMAGTKAWNGPGKNGYYTEALLRHLKKGNTLEQTMKSVRSDVLEMSKQEKPPQRPDYLNQTADDLIF